MKASAKVEPRRRQGAEFGQLARRKQKQEGEKRVSLAIVANLTAQLFNLPLLALDIRVLPSLSWWRLAFVAKTRKTRLNAVHRRRAKLTAQTITLCIISFCCSVGCSSALSVFLLAEAAAAAAATSEPFAYVTLSALKTNK